MFLLWRAAVESSRGGRYARLLLHWPGVWRGPKDGTDRHNHAFLHFLWGQGGSEASSTRVQLDWIKQDWVLVHIQVSRLTLFAISLTCTQHHQRCLTERVKCTEAHFCQWDRKKLRCCKFAINGHREALSHPLTLSWVDIETGNKYCPHKYMFLLYFCTCTLNFLGEF